MMWEDEQGASSKWFHYICVFLLIAKVSERSLIECKATLPSTFDTPMFWTADELEELKGTSLVGLSVPSVYSRLLLSGTLVR